HYLGSRRASLCAKACVACTPGIESSRRPPSCSKPNACTIGKRPETPRMPERDIPVAKPFFGPEETAAVARVLASGWVTQGPEVASFEREFAAFVGAPFACATSSCTTALHLALHALGVGPGDEVITVSHS